MEETLQRWDFDDNGEMIEVKQEEKTSEAPTTAPAPKPSKRRSIPQNTTSEVLEKEVRYVNFYGPVNCKVDELYF